MSNENENQTVTRNAQALQGALDEIHAMQMKIDSALNQIKTAHEFKKDLTKTQIQDIHDDLLELNSKLLKIIPVLVG